MSSSQFAPLVAGDMRRQYNSAGRHDLHSSRSSGLQSTVATSHTGNGVSQYGSQYSTGPHMPSQQGSPSLQSETQTLEIVGLDDDDEDEIVQIFVNWQAMLEPLEVSIYCTIMDLSHFVDSAPEAQAAHKFFIFRGVQLHPSFTLEQAMITDGSVLHLILNDDPYRGRPIYVRVKDGSEDEGRIRMIMCGADFYIADVKEELSYLHGEAQPHEMRLLFAGRELQDQHTLREYNIQKPSVLNCISPANNGRQLENFVTELSPARDQVNVGLNAKIILKMIEPGDNELHFWGQMLGGPDLNTFLSQHFKVAATNLLNSDVIEGDVSVDLRGSRVIWTPRSPLLPRTHYTVTVHKESADALLRAQKEAKDSTTTSEKHLEDDPLLKKHPCIRHSRAKQHMQGWFSWNFFTQGYEPLRITAVHPLPHSSVCAQRAVVVVQFSGDLHPACPQEEWITVRGHNLQPPVYHAPTKSLVYGFAEPLVPNEICRVRIHTDKVRGSRGESLLPRQKDGLVKTSLFRFKFYTRESTGQYEELNTSASGCREVVDLWEMGVLRPPLPPQPVVPAGNGSTDALANISLNPFDHYYTDIPEDPVTRGPAYNSGGQPFAQHSLQGASPRHLPPNYHDGGALGWLGITNSGISDIGNHMGGALAHLTGQSQQPRVLDGRNIYGLQANASEPRTESNGHSEWLF
eukprot:Tamp_06596.p1 GENE.Tamp_06596~~Tamp_06596.p1  ORF type:complete len:687 (-),score=57.34 Tamp_06596:479-2539(-)